MCIALEKGSEFTEARVQKVLEVLWNCKNKQNCFNESIRTDSIFS